jgi:nitrate reductase NapE component
MESLPQLDKDTEQMSAGVGYLLSPLVMFCVGVTGFVALGYANQKLANGLRFRENSPSQKRIIVAVSIAQFPYLFMAVFGGFGLLGWINRVVVF